MPLQHFEGQCAFARTFVINCVWFALLVLLMWIVGVVCDFVFVRCMYLALYLVARMYVRMCKYARPAPPCASACASSWVYVCWLAGTKVYLYLCDAFDSVFCCFWGCVFV